MLEGNQSEESSEKESQREKILLVIRASFINKKDVNGQVIFGDLTSTGDQIKLIFTDKMRDILSKVQNIEVINDVEFNLSSYELSNSKLGYDYYKLFGSLTKLLEDNYVELSKRPKTKQEGLPWGF